jgi:predicted nucleotidyltransferase
MPTTDSLQKALKRLKPYLSEHYHVASLALFGSYARGEQNEGSDIDVLVDFHTTPDLLSFIEMEEFLHAQLHHPIDLVPKRKLKPRLKEQILREAIVI